MMEYIEEVALLPSERAAQDAFNRTQALAVLEKTLRSNLKCAALEKDRSCFVYRAFAHDGTLLYVGQTVNVRRRLSAHKGSSTWWPYMVRNTIVEYPNRSAALIAEYDAILTESPRHNFVWDGDYFGQGYCPEPRSTSGSSL